MPFTPEQKRRIVELNGLNPDEYDFNESDETLIPRPKSTQQPSGAPTTTVNLPKVPEAPSILDTARRGATESLLPTLAGLGATAGAAALGPPGWLGAGLALIAGTGAGIGAGALQKAVVPEQTQQDLFLRPEDIEQNKYTSILSGFLPGMLAFRPSLHELPQVLGGIKALPRALSAGEAALTTGQKAALFNAAANTLPSAGMYGYDVLKGNREFDLGSLAAETLPGLLMTKPTPIGRAMGFGDPGFRPEVNRTLTPAEPGLTPVEPTPIRRAAALLPEESLSTLQRRQEISQVLTEPVPPSRVERRRAIEEQRALAAEQEAALARQKALKDADYRRMEAEVEAENQKAIAAEMEVERLKAENERRKVDLAIGGKKGYGEEQGALARLQDQIKSNQVKPVTTEEVVSKVGENPRDYQQEAAVREYNKAEEFAKQQAEERRVRGLQLAREELKRMFDEAPSPEIILDKEKNLKAPVEGPKATTLDTSSKAEEPTFGYSNPLGENPKTHKYKNKLNEGKGFYSEGSDLPPMDSTPIETLQPEDKAKIKKEIERVARLRRMKVRYVDSLKKGDKEVLGRYDPTTREFLLNRKLYAGDTAPHEIAHGRILDLLESGSEKDRGLVLKGLEFADEKGRKFKTVEDYKKLPVEEQMAIEENFTKSVGPEGYRRQRQELYGKKRERFVEWIKQIGNHFKVKTGAADSNELYQHFVERQMFDAPDSGRAELSGVRMPAAGPKKEVKEEKKGLPFSEESDLPAVDPVKRYQIAREYLDDKLEKILKSVDEQWEAANEPKAFRLAEGEKLKSTLGSWVRQAVLDEHPMAGDLGLSGIKPFIKPEIFPQIKEAVEAARKFAGLENRPFNEDEAVRMAEEKRRAFYRHSEESDLPPVDANPPRTGALTRLTSSAVKAIRNLGGETAAHVSKQSEKYFSLKSLYEGKYANNVQADIVSAPKEVRDRVDQYGREMHTEGSSDITLSPEEQNLYDSMREYLVNVADENTAREIKKDPNYWPAILDTRVAEMWSKAPNSPEGRRYQREWMQHAQQQVDKGRANYTHDELKDILDEYMAALGSDGREGSLEFGALRKAAGLGLPISMQDNNLLSRFTRYGRRVAKDMAFREAVEMDPTMRYMFIVKDDAGQVLTEPPTLPSGNLATDEIRGSRPLQDIQRAMYEEFPNKRSPRINAISRAVSSSMLGTVTGIRDVVTGPNVILSLIGTRNAKALAEGLTNLRQGYDESFQYGARKLRMNELEFGSAASPDTLTRWFNEVADAARKYSGREALEQFQRAYFWNVSKVATVAEFGRAANGNETSIKWLKDHSITVDNLDSYIGKNAADIPEEVINRIAKEVTEKAAGTYDPRGLPAGVMEGPLAPFFSLSRWSIERTNRIVEDVLAPARSGNFVPLLTYTAGSFLTGAAIQELNELMSGGKRGFSPTLKEAEAAQEGQVRAVVNLLQLGSFAGIIGDMMKSATEAYAGHLPRGLSFPLADFVSQTLGQNLSDYFAALQAGEDKTEASLGLAERLLVDSIQSARMVSYLTWRQDEVGRKNEYRDFRLWKELSGQKAPESSIGRPNEFLNKREKAFKRASSVEEIGKTFEPALEAAVNKAQTPEDLKRNVEGLGRNSYQTWPTEPREMVKYYEYLKESQGEEAAAASFESFLQQRELNKLKSRMVPKL